MIPKSHNQKFSNTRMADRIAYEFVSMVRGYHEYRSVWSAVVGEELQCRIELSNPHDLFAVAVCKSHDILVGHVPKETCVIVQNSVFQGYLFSRTSKNPRKPQNFCHSKISSYTVYFSTSSFLIAEQSYQNCYCNTINQPCFKSSATCATHPLLKLKRYILLVMYSE